MLAENKLKTVARPLDGFMHLKRNAKLINLLCTVYLGFVLK